MPQVIALALLGAGFYAGYRWFARAAGGMGATIARAKDERRQAAPKRSLAAWHTSRAHYWDPFWGPSSGPTPAARKIAL